MSPRPALRRSGCLDAGATRRTWTDDAGLEGGPSRIATRRAWIDDAGLEGGPSRIATRRAWTDDAGLESGPSRVATRRAGTDDAGFESGPSRIVGRWALVTACILLSGCALLQPPTHEDPFAGAMRSCLEANKQFVDAWGCVQSRDTLSETGSEDPRRKQFMKLGDGLAAEVSASKLSNAEARKRLTAGLPVDDGS